jgi:hypothetical protein
MKTSYSDCLVTYLLLFYGAKDPPEVHDWLYSTESKFGLLHCTVYQKTLYAAQ